jgi:transposase
MVDFNHAENQTMTMREIAQYFGVTRNVADGWKFRGELPSPKVTRVTGNKPFLYLKKDILELEAQGFPGYLKHRPPRNDPWPWPTKLHRDLQLAQKFYRILGGRHENDIYRNT